MTSSQALNYEAIATQLLEQLSRTPYACSSLSPRLGSLPVNFVYRGILAKPILAQDTVTTKSIIIKHSPDALPKVLEELLLNSLSNISTSITGANVKSPRLYLYDRETNTQVFEDLSDTIQFMTVLSSANIHSVLPFPSTTTVGRHLGVWLRSFHIWASSPDQVDLRKHICQNDHMRKTKYIFTYDSVFKVLKIFPELLEGFEQTLSTILDIIAKEFERPTTVEGEDYGLLHGDLWSGNILFPSAGWQEPPIADKFHKLFIIDWEMAQFGHHSSDLGQIVGDLFERKIYRNLDTAVYIMRGVIDGYGTLSDDMAFRTAIYVGVHLISWYNRRPQKGPRVIPSEVIVAGLTTGRDFMMKGWERDRDFFQNSALASLFATTE